MFQELLKMLSSGNLGDVESKAGDLLTRLEKLGADVIGSNGNLVQTVVTLAEDFATLKAAISDIVAIVGDLKGLTQGLSAVHANLSAAVASVPASSAVATGGTGSPVTPMGILQAAETVVAQVAPALAQVAADPFAAKPLTRISAVVEPRGGA